MTKTNVRYNAALLGKFVALEQILYGQVWFTRIRLLRDDTTLLIGTNTLKRLLRRPK